MAKPVLERRGVCPPRRRHSEQADQLRHRAEPGHHEHPRPSTAFDLLELNGEHLRPRPLGERKARLATLLGRKTGAIVFNEHTDEDGATVFLHACKLGFEGIVSKRLSATYKSGPSRDWIKVKNPDSPAMLRHREGNW
jgi:ATP-dependent DNA ligase